MKYEAIIFDCDGTLVNSMPAHYLAWVETLEPYGIHYEEELFYSMGGWSTPGVAQYLLDQNGIEGDAEKIADDKEDAFIKHLNAVEPIAQTIDVVEEHHGKIPLAVATGGIPRICHPMLQNLDLFKYFETIVTALDVSNHKPAPDTYLEAANRLGVNPNQCLAYEDTDPGIQSAKQAGMTTIDVRSYFTPQRMSNTQS